MKKIILLLLVVLISCGESSDNITSNQNISSDSMGLSSDSSLSSSSNKESVNNDTNSSSISLSSSSMVSSSNTDSLVNSSQSTSESSSLDSVISSSDSSFSSSVFSSDSNLSSSDSLSNIIYVSNGEELQNALLNAKAGDHIVLRPAIYKVNVSTIEYATMQRNVYFYSRNSGTKEAPIILESEDVNNKAILEGNGPQNSEYCLWINGQYWIIKNIIIRNSGKGLILDEASYSVIDGVEVYNIGDEGIHLRSGTSHTIIKNTIVDSTGLEQPGFGEGIYIGSDNGQWDKYDMHCDSNIVEYCIIKSTAAEAFDIKEGTEGNIIRNCEIHGNGVSGTSNNYADSFIDLKGNGARVYNNTFYQDGNLNVTRGVAIVDRAQSSSGSGIIDHHPDMSLEEAQALTANRNWIWGNKFYLDDENGYMVYAYRGSDNYAWDNTRIPSNGNDYKGNEPELYIMQPLNFNY